MDTRYLFILQKFLEHWYKTKIISKKYSSKEVFDQFMKEFDFGLKFVGPHLSNKTDIETRYD